MTLSLTKMFRQLVPPPPLEICTGSSGPAQGALQPLLEEDADEDEDEEQEKEREAVLLQRKNCR